MTVIVTVLLPLFCLMLAGWFAARRQLVDRGGIAGLNGFVFYFALPLMLFHNVAQAPLGEHVDGAYMVAYLLPGLTINLVAVAIARWFWGRGLGGQAVHGIAATFGNSVFIALPLSLELFGPRAALPMTSLIAVENGLLLPLAVAMLELDRPVPGMRRQALRAALLAILRNPVVMSVLAGGSCREVGGN
jgi:malonate transporter